MGESPYLCWGPVGNGSPWVMFGVKSPSVGAERPSFCIRSVKSPTFVVAKCEDVKFHKGFLPLVYVSHVDFRRYTHGSQTMGLYKNGSLRRVYDSLVLGMFGVIDGCNGFMRAKREES